MRTVFLMSALLILAVVLTSGCGKTEKTSPDRVDTFASADKGDSDHDHSEWWCNEHGMPEEICAQCDSKLAATFQKKGDWCKEHDRPDSQCFICHPELEAKFAAQYEAKYGKKPPKPEAETERK